MHILHSLRNVAPHSTVICLLAAALFIPTLRAQDNGSNELDRLLERVDKNKKMIFSSNGQYLAEFSGWVNVWSIKEKRRVYRFQVDGTVLAVAFTPNGEELVSADGVGNLDYVSTIKAWNLKTGAARTIGRCLGSVTDFSFSPDGSRLAATVKLGLLGSMASLGDDMKKDLCGGRMYVWQMSDETELLNIEFGLPGLLAELKAIPGSELDATYEKAARKAVPIQLRFSPDGSRLIAVTKSGREMIVDSKTGKKKEALKSTSEGEQQEGGADQPAPAPESKWKGNDKSKPELEPKKQEDKKVPSFKLTDETGSFKMEVKEGGALSLNGKAIGRLKGDGVMLSDNGEELARLKPDGAILAKGGKAIGKIFDNGDIDIAPGMKASWKNDKIDLGRVFKLDSKVPESKRWASFVLLLFMTPSKQAP